MMKKINFIFIFFVIISLNTYGQINMGGMTEYTLSAPWYYNGHMAEFYSDGVLLVTKKLKEGANNIYVSGYGYILINLNYISSDGSGQNTYKFYLDVFPSSDLDGDGILDSEDPDIDGDGLLNDFDPFPEDPNGDLDGDGISDNQDLDIDGDGLGNNVDPTPFEFDDDIDDDGIKNIDDDDMDGDGVNIWDDPNDLDPFSNNTDI
ncbi:hypothetical protein P4E94_19650, partial [Pontiellaceae bacterium B12219]|nr:hypothetical protein [Pontiellaceae bacterium B12219]